MLRRQWKARWKRNPLESSPGNKGNVLVAMAVRSMTSSSPVTINCVQLLGQRMSPSLILRECWWNMSCGGLGLCTDMQQQLHAQRKVFHSSTHFPTHMSCTQHTWLPVVLGLRPPKPSPFHVRVSVGVSVPQVILVRLHGQSFSHSSRRRSLTVNVLFFWL